MADPGTIADQLIAGATAIGEAHPDENVAIIVGSSSHATHRVVGSVAVGLARSGLSQTESRHGSATGLERHGQR